MFDQESISAVMRQTGVDRETAAAALKTSDGNIDIAVRIIRSYNLKDDAASSGETAGANPGQASGQTEGKKDDGRIPQASEVIDAIKEIWKRGNASRLDIEKGGRVVLSISLTVGTIGLVIAPVAALIGLGAALITEYTIKVTLDNGTVINVNEFAVLRKHTTEPRDSGEPRDQA